METPLKDKYITSFKISIDDLECGWETISLIFNGAPISFNASYIGAEPLTTLIEAVNALDRESFSEGDTSQYFIDWGSEPGCMRISLNHNRLSNRLSIAIKKSKCEDINDDSIMQWDFVMDYSLFRQTVVDIIISALNKYGICGLNQSWDAAQDVLPVGTLLSILGAKTYSNNNDHSLKSNLTEEIAVLTSIISHNRQQ